jgi:hypothetical protein
MNRPRQSGSSGNWSEGKAAQAPKGIPRLALSTYESTLRFQSGHVPDENEVGLLILRI